MSSTEDQSELKAGHPPAVKAGGMRITQHKSPHPPEKPTPPTTEEKEGEEGKEKPEGEEGDEEITEEEQPRQTLVISGAVARGDADFPPEAVKAYHEKPLPSHDFRNTGSKPNIIHQPRKQ